MDNKIDILIGTRDRPTELFGLLLSLKFQTYQGFNIFIQDDCGGTPIQNYYFINNILTRLKLENHGVFIKRNDIPKGVSMMRNEMAKWCIEENTGAELILRVDDDTILDKDFLEKLVNGMDKDYDIMSGVTPPIMLPQSKRSTKYVKPFISELKINDMGDITQIGDECGFMYLEDEIIPSQHFRSFALYKKSIHTEGDVWYSENLSFAGWREEEFLALGAIAKGYKIGIDTQAICWHMLTPSGGNKFQNIDMMKINDECLQKFTKNLFIKYGNFIEKYNKKILEDKNENS